MRADFNSFKTAQNISFHHDKLANAIQHNRIFKCRNIKPAAPARTPGGGTKLVADLSAFAISSNQLGREGTAANTGAICFKNTIYFAYSSAAKRPSPVQTPAHTVLDEVTKG